MQGSLPLKCDLAMEIQLIVFKCKVCLGQCAFGRYMIKEFERWELENYHHRIETE